MSMPVERLRSLRHRLTATKDLCLSWVTLPRLTILPSLTTLSRLRTLSGLRTLFGLSILFGLSLGFAGTAWATEDGELHGVAVEGTDKVRLLPPAGATIASYRNVGYDLDVRDGEVYVQVHAAPLESRSRLVPQWSEQGKAVGRMAKALVTGSRSHYEAVSRVLAWVARHVDYELDRELPQDSESVLERRTGYCTGIARLTVSLLRASGIEAREVAGYVLGDETAGTPYGYHRWIEALLPDVGWVYSDPLYSHHFVPATYVRLDSEQLDLQRGLRGLMIERQDAMTPVDLYPPGVPGIKGRRNTSRQLAGALHVALEGSSQGMVVLEGNARRWSHALVSGQTTFIGLEPGDYSLRVVSDRGMVERQFELLGRERARLHIRDQPIQGPLGDDIQQQSDLGLRSRGVSHGAFRDSRAEASGSKHHSTRYPTLRGAHGSSSTEASEAMATLGDHD